MCLSFIILKTQAQNTAEDKLGSWFMFNGSHKLSENYTLKSMAHFRYFELSKEFQQEIYRLGLNYKFNPKTNFTFGLSYATGDLNYNTPSAHLYEWRLYEDLFLKSKLNKLNLKHRFRLEHRFIHKNLTTNTTQNWIRYDLNISYPISQKLNIYVFNELFLNLDRSKRFAQNWTGLGLIQKLNKRLKLKLGYFQIKTSNRNLKRLQLGVILNTNHTKKTI